jgi:hypothetical protein
MAFTPTNKLVSDSNINLRDYQHAARVFVDDQFRLAPKLKFLFHVAFSINPAALKNINLVQRHRNEIGVLVKSAALPAFTITTDMANQYNRKKYIQSQHKPNDVDIVFHDDNMGIINQLWQNYYSYYYADPTSANANGAYNRTATRNSNYITTPYGLDNGSTVPFFNYITIYQLARHEYVSYKLINPIITSWLASTLAYKDESSTADNTMRLGYEAVAYGSGLISDGTVEGFATEHYDQTPSPLTSGASNSSASPSFANSTNVTNGAANDLNIVTQQINTYENTKGILAKGTPGILTNLITSSTQGVSGLQGIAFPVPNQQQTTATLINIGI